MTKLKSLLAITLVLSGLPSLAASKPPPLREVINLDGQWQVAEGPLEAPPANFTHTVPVPGLLDMAQPPFAGVGKQSALRQAFWYRRTFKIVGEVPPVALLKVNKACYGTAVWLNGQSLGEHLPSFTPGYFHLHPHLKGQGQENELVIRVGADREALPKGMPTGWDFEKYLYLPGIYDSVELILTATPYIVSVQAVPDLKAQAVRVVAEIESGEESGEVVVKAEVSPARSKRIAGDRHLWIQMARNEFKTVELVVPIADCRLWSPEDPYLYELNLSTRGDAVKTRFGMRTFSFEPGGKYARLNGKRYFLRGSNVTAYRFFEDAARGDKPWRAEWVRRLHQEFKSMHWNSLRYCIGFPPDFWYDIADEEGFLIQDEFPIWTLGEDPEKLEAGKIIPEYIEWMRERWNHPSVVIWDAQNESSIKASGQALQAVRALDLSNRPWENGWAEPQAPTDCVEAHPYLMIGLFNPAWGNTNFTSLKDMVRVSGIPSLNDAQRRLPVPILINEYAWLWLTREGQPTCLTGPVYDKLLGPGSTAEQRRLLYAKLLAAKTEFWRAHRECAGVLHFCALGYSRPGDKPRPEGGATSDHWLDLEKLKFEPNFEKYVREAFNPVGVMLNFWEEQVVPGASPKLEVYVINDLEAPWKGKVRLRVLKGSSKVSEQVQSCTVESFGRQILSFSMAMPTKPGSYTLVAELDGKGAGVRSVRDFRIGAAQK